MFYIAAPFGGAGVIHPKILGGVCVCVCVSVGYWCTCISVYREEG